MLRRQHKVNTTGFCKHKAGLRRCIPICSGCRCLIMYPVCLIITIIFFLKKNTCCYCISGASVCNSAAFRLHKTARRSADGERIPYKAPAPEPCCACNYSLSWDLKNSRPFKVFWMFPEAYRISAESSAYSRPACLPAAHYR